jgi:hypothetical protein
MTESAVVGWDNFYVMIGSSAAALTGLTFVVIALAADARRITSPGLRAFVTPSIVHFGTVLAISAFLNVPRQTVTSLCAGLAVVGCCGLIHTGFTFASMRQIGQVYVPVREDWIWHVILPAAFYLVLLAMAIVGWTRTNAALYGVAAACTAMLFIGIHNAWDVAVSISTRNQQDTHTGGESAP